MKPTTLARLWSFPLDLITHLLDSCDERGGCVETGAYLWKGLKDCSHASITLELEAAHEGLVGIYPTGKSMSALLLRETADGSCSLSIGPWEPTVAQLWKELNETDQ